MSAAVHGRSKQRVGKAQNHQILDRFLAEVVVDAVDLLFAEDAADRVVDLARGLQIVSDRLLQHHAGLRRDKLRCGQVGADRREQAWGGGQIEHAYGGSVREQGRKAGEARRIRRVYRRIPDARTEAFQRTRRRGSSMSASTRCGELVSAERLLARADYPAVAGEARLRLPAGPGRGEACAPQDRPSRRTARSRSPARAFAAGRGEESGRSTRGPRHPISGGIGSSLIRTPLLRYRRGPRSPGRRGTAHGRRRHGTRTGLPRRVDVRSTPRGRP